MYDFPIQLKSMIDEAAMECQRKLEDEILMQVKLQVGIEIDRDKLIQAMTADMRRYNEAYTEGFNYGADLCYEAMSQNQWIDPKDKLPPYNELVLCIGLKGELCFCKFTGRYWLKYNMDGDVGKIARTAKLWMPIPPMPKGMDEKQNA